MVVIDTSVWVAFLRGDDTPLVTEVKQLLDHNTVVLAAPVWVEIISGASRVNITKLKRLFSALPRCYPTMRTWEIVDGWLDVAVPTGQRFGMADLLIGAIACENGGVLWSLDGDFGRMQKLGFVSLFGK